MDGSDILGDLRSAIIRRVFNLPTRLFGRCFLRALDTQILLDYLGFSKFLSGLICDLRATSLEVCFLPSVVIVSRQRSFFQVSSLLSDGICSVLSFPHVLRGGEGKIEVIE